MSDKKECGNCECERYCENAHNTEGTCKTWKAATTEIVEIKEYELLKTDLKLAQHEQAQLKDENTRLKEEIETLKGK